MKKLPFDSLTYPVCFGSIGTSNNAAHDEGVITMPELYSSSRDTLLAQGDKNFCVPLAISIASGVDVEKINNVMMATRSSVRRGPMRRKGQGVYDVDWNNHDFLAQFGIQLQPMIGIKSRTVSKLEHELPAGNRYIVKVRRHVLCVREGRVQDWTEGRRHRVAEVFVVCDLNGNPLTDNVDASAVPAKPVSPSRPVAFNSELFETLTRELALWDVKQSGRWVSVKFTGERAVKITQSKGRVVVCINHNDDARLDLAHDVLTQLSVRKNEITFTVSCIEETLRFLRNC